MAWDFSGPEPEVIVYETKADVPYPFYGNLIERNEAGQVTLEWFIRFPATSYDAAYKKAQDWWRYQRDEHQAKLLEAEKRQQGRAALRAANAAAKAVKEQGSTT
jgi:hypothetical protein